ncbi:MAG: VanZ family protein [Thermodesulfobacteriota bacterium]
MTGRSGPARDWLLCTAWLVLIFLFMYYGRALDPWFEGGRAFWAAALLGLAGLGLAAWLYARWRRLPRPRRARVGLGLLGCLAGLGLLAWWQPILIERTHLLLYGVLGIFTWRLAGRYASGARRLLYAAAACALVGLADEGAQHLHPQRVFDLRDAVTNALSAWLLLAAIWLLRPPEPS